MKHKKRMISMLLSLCLVMGLLFTAAFAEETGTTTTNKTLMLGTGGISSPTAKQTDKGTYKEPESYIYFGMDGSTPIKWRVLDAETANDGTTNGMFLLSEYLLGYTSVYFQKNYHIGNNSTYHKGEAPDGSHDNCVIANVYQGSDAQEWCTNFATNTGNFSSAEQNAFLGLAKTDAAEKLYSIKWAEANLTADDKLFFLSAREVSDYVSNYEGAPGMVATNTSNKKDKWWLRSPYELELYLDQVGSVYTTGNVAEGSVKSKGSARPAFNLNSEMVLFSTSAKDGKSGDVGTLSTIDTYDGKEWKLTLLDSSRQFTVDKTAVVGRSGKTVSLGYSGAVTGENEYISVIFEKAGNFTHYGKVAAATSASGTVEIPIPSDLADGEYKIYIFSEQCNGDKKTDYASNFKVVTLTVDNTAPTLTMGTATRTNATNATVTFTSDEAGTYYYAVVESGADEPTIDTTKTGKTCDTALQTISFNELNGFGAKDIYIQVKDAVGNVSQMLKMEIPAFIPVYTVKVDNVTLDFGTGTTTKYAVPEAKTVTVTNTGNVAITLNQPTAENYIIGTLSTTSLAANGGTATFTVQPKGNLAVGTYNETIRLTDSTGTATASVDPRFSVEKKSISITGATAKDRDYASGNTTVEIDSVTFSDGMTLEKGTDYTAIGIMTNADADEGGKDVSVTVTLIGTVAEDYKLADSTFKTTVKISRIAYNGTTTATGSAKYGNSASMDLGSIVMSGGKATIKTVSDSNGVLDTCAIENGISLKFSFKDTAAVDATATVTLDVADCTNYTDYTIIVTLTVKEKDVPVVEAPAAKTLTYNGTPQILITAGSTTGGTLQYSLDNSTWSAELPTAKNADTYTVYYRVEGDADYADTAVNSISVTIEKKAVTVKPQSYTITQGEGIPAFTLEYIGLVDGETLNITTMPVFTCCEADGNTAVSTSTTAGKYTITWTNPDAFDFDNETNYTVTKATTGTLTINETGSGTSDSQQKDNGSHVGMWIAGICIIIVGVLVAVLLLKRQLAKRK